MGIDALRPGDPARVGPCRLLGRLGQGGTGTVYLGVTDDDRAVAVKVLRDRLGDGAADEEGRRRFRHELAALRRVRGPHLVEVLDADVDADTPWIITRFVPGRRLDAVVAEQGPLAEPELLRVARGTATALAALHAAGLVHRDLTPGNVLLVDGEPHVIDLGLATAGDVTALTRSGTVVGTPGYLAPEQVLGTGSSAASDVHAWGATVALAATGRPPYGTGRPEAVLYRVVHDRPDLGGLPPRLLHLVERATSADPLDRPTARELVAALGGPSTAEPATVVLPSGTTPEQALTTRLGPSTLAAARTPATAVLAAEPRTDALPLAPAPLLPEPRADDDRTRDRTRDHPDGPDRPDDDRYGDDGPYDERGARGGEPVRGGLVTAATALGLVTVGAAACVLPVVVALLTTTAVLLLQGVARAGAAVDERRARRGERRRDAAVSTLALPWHAVRAAGDLLRAAPVALLLVGPPVVLVALLAQDGPGRSTAGGAATAVGVVGGLLVVLSRRELGRARRALRRGLLLLAPGPRRTVGVLAALAVLAVVAVAATEQAGTSWWPLAG